MAKIEQKTHHHSKELVYKSKLTLPVSTLHYDSCQWSLLHLSQTHTILPNLETYKNEQQKAHWSKHIEI